MLKGKAWGLMSHLLLFPQGHPFIMQFNDGDATVVSVWVCRALEERRSRQAPP